MPEVQQTKPPVLPAVAFEEFRMMYEFTERVTDRRLELNWANASLSILVIAGMGIVAGWGYEKPGVMAIVLGLIFVVSALGLNFCRWWHAQLKAYKDLNGAKFEVLDEMAELVVFPSVASLHLRSARPFKREWAKLEAKKELKDYKTMKALGSSPSELAVPLSFLIFFAIACVASVVLEWVLYASSIAKILSGL